MRMLWHFSRSAGVRPGPAQHHNNVLAPGRRPALRRLTTFAALVIAPLSLLAQPKVTSISPDWIQRGAMLNVTIAGDGLGSVTGFVFSGESGLSAAVIVESNPPPTVTVESASKGIAVAATGGRDRNKSLRASITAVSDAPLGVRELRAIGPNGISSPLNITVGAVPEITEVEPNNSIDQAQTIPLPAVISGSINASTEIDHFRIKAKKNDQLVLEVIAQRTGSPLDSSLAILDANGKELARNEDARGFDSLLEFTAPEDGDYIAQLRDFEYRGGGNYQYKLFAGVLPYVDYIFPFGGQRGKPVEISVVGRNMQGAEKMTLNIDGNAPLGRQEIRLNTPRGLSNPIQFDVQNVSEFTEAEPNNAATNANSVTVPIFINGRVGAAKDADRFKFKAASDQKILCAIEARRFGSPLDALLAVYAGDSLVAQNDDADGVDARIEFDAKKDTEYTVVVRDLTDRGGPQFTYRLAIRPSSSAAPTLAAKYFPDAVRLNRGGRTRIRCEVVRQGFDAPVRFSAADLPAGVSADPIVVPAGRTEGDMLLSAAAGADMTTLPLRIVANASAGGKEIMQIASAIAPAEQGEKAFKQGFLSVFDSAPFTVDALTIAGAMDQLQSTAVDVFVNRRAGFTGDVKLSAVGFSLGRAPITKSLDVKEITVKNNEATAKLTFTAKVDSEVGTRAVLVRGEATDNGEAVVQFSQPLALSVAQIPFVLSAAPSKLALNAPRAGSTNVDDVALKVKVERRGFAGEIPLILNGLPDGVKVDGTNVAANAADTTLTFTATDKTPAVTNATVTIRGAAMHNDRLYRHQAGGIKLSISTPPVEVASTNAAVVPR